MSLHESQKLYSTTLEQVTSLQKTIDGSKQLFSQQEEEKSEVNTTNCVRNYLRIASDSIILYTL